MSGEFADPGAATDVSDGDVKPTDTPGARPEWFPEKFAVMDANGHFDVSASAQKMAEGNASLEKLLGEKGNEPPKGADATSPTDGDNAGGTDPDASGEATTPPVIKQAEDYFAEHGELSEDMYKALEAAGYPKDKVDHYIQLQKDALTHSASVEAAKVHESVGGEETYNSMLQWAAANMSEAEIAAYDSVIENGAPEAVSLAVTGLKARFDAANGVKPTYVGDTPGAGNVAPFESQTQLIDAMSDPRYQRDDAYRAEVERRLAATSL